LPDRGTADLGQGLAVLVARWQLPHGSSARLEQLLTALAEDPRAPSSVRDPERALDVHVADSLSGFEVDGLRDLPDVADIGSGAGFPGLVLALAMPNARFDLVEANARKCTWIERMAERVEIDNVRVVNARAEEWGARGGSEAYVGVVVRAVGSLSTLLEYAAPLLRENGLLVAWKGRRDPAEEAAAEQAADILGMAGRGVTWVGAYAGSRNRHIYLFEKIAPTPERFPRRAGVASKRPLGN
jgi:16S rRNA (guanine527-N7)-methyltransferase